MATALANSTRASADSSGCRQPDRVPQDHLVVLRGQLDRSFTGCRCGGAVAPGRRLLGVVHRTVGTCDGEQPGQLLERHPMVLDTQVEQSSPRRRPIPTRRHDQRGRLAAPDVAALTFGGQQRREEPGRKVAPGTLEGGEHRGRHGRALHHVCLHADPGQDQVGGVSDALRAGVCGRSPLRVDHPHLAHGFTGVVVKDGPERLGRGPPLAHQAQAVVAERNLGERLRRDGTHTRLDPGHDAADAEPAGLDGSAELPG